MIKIIKRYKVTSEDVEAIREAMRAIGMKGTVRKGQGSCKYWVGIKTADERIVDLVTKLNLGFRLLYMPNTWDPRYTFEKSDVIYQGGKEHD